MKKDLATATLTAEKAKHEAIGLKDAAERREQEALERLSEAESATKDALAEVKSLKTQLQNAAAAASKHVPKAAESPSLSGYLTPARGRQLEVLFLRRM